MIYVIITKVFLNCRNVLRIQIIFNVPAKRQGTKQSCRDSDEQLRENDSEKLLEQSQSATV